MAVIDERADAATMPAPVERPPAAERQGPRRVSGAEVTISLFDFVRRLVRGRWLLLGGTVLGLAIGVLLFFQKPAYFLAEATFLPPPQPEPTLSPLSLVMPQQGDSTDTYMTLLASRSVADDVIEHMRIKQHFKLKSSLLARNTLAGMTKFGISRNQLITVSVKDPDPGFAADVANAYLEALYRQNGAMVTSASSHRERFFEGQLREQKDELNQAETDLRRTQERTGIVQPEGEAAAGLSAVASLQSQINAAETRLSGLLAGATEQNPVVVQARRELASLRFQLAQQQAASTRRPGEGLASTSELPELTLEYTRRARELKLREGLYDSLAQQYERARVASTDPGPQLQVVDSAIRPERKAGPHGRDYAMAGGALGFLAALGYLMLAGPLMRVFRAYQRFARESAARPS